MKRKWLHFNIVTSNQQLFFCQGKKPQKREKATPSDVQMADHLLLNGRQISLRNWWGLNQSERSKYWTSMLVRHKHDY